jgi:phosphonopyruvate decarboxylase
MISPKKFHEEITKHGIEYFTGVPDTILKDLCAYLIDVTPSNHTIAANEGNAIALAAGWYLGNGNPAMVYMQNSGLGNSINPLVSLADPEVYGIPMLLVIGLRGEPGKKDEPQHVKQGQITQSLLDALGIPSYIIGSETPNVETILETTCKLMKEESRPVGLVVKAGTFEEYIPQNENQNRYSMSREEAINEFVASVRPDELLISTTGKASRELYECRLSRGETLENDFLTVGSMGHASSIAMGLAQALPGRRVFCLDGDGSAIMHMGSMAIIGQNDLKNLIHVILNNGSHDSVGGQPTVGQNIHFEDIGRACGYRWTTTIDRPEQIGDAIQRTRDADGPFLIDVRIRKGARSDLGRPEISPKENKKAFMSKLDN